MGIIVENGGILTTVQDEGRFGYQAFGVSTSGAMDNQSFHIANILVGNDMGEGALEMTFIGPTLKFTSDNIVAVTGGDLTPMLDGNEFPMYRAVLVKEGQTLSFAGARNGCRGYIAFAGGLDIPIVMGSKSTLLRNHLGGVKGRKLEKGDEIGFVSAKTILPNMEARKVTASVYPKKEIVPAGVFYYRIQDPFVEAPKEKEEVETLLLKELKPDGMINLQDEVLLHLDRNQKGESLAVPVKYNLNGSLGRGSKAVAQEAFQTMMDYAVQKAEEIRGKIASGDVTAAPYRRGKETACDYCRYRHICGFDSRLAGYQYLEEVLANMQKDVKETGKGEA